MSGIAHAVVKENTNGNDQISTPVDEILGLYQLFSVYVTVRDLEHCFNSVDNADLQGE